MDNKTNLFKTIKDIQDTRKTRKKTPKCYQKRQNTFEN